MEPFAEMIRPTPIPASVTRTAKIAPSETTSLHGRRRGGGARSGRGGTLPGNHWEGCPFESGSLSRGATESMAGTLATASGGLDHLQRFLRRWTSISSGRRRKAGVLPARGIAIHRHPLTRELSSGPKGTLFESPEPVGAENLSRVVHAASSYSGIRPPSGSRLRILPRSTAGRSR